MPSTLPLSARLRQATLGIHRETEGRVDLDAWLSSPEVFARYLRRLAAWWRAVDARFSPLAPTYLGTAERANAIHQDLARMGADTHLEELPDLRGLDLANPARLRGFGYVVFGSRLGGQVIASRARERFGDELALGALADSRAPDDWRRVRGWIDGLGTAPLVVLDSTRTARETFARMGGYLSASCVERDPPLRL